MNKVFLIGNLCRDTELRATTSGKSVIANTIAVARTYKDANGEYPTDYIDIVAYGTTAEFLARNSAKGFKVAVIGEWQVRKYTAKDGTARYVHECIVSECQLLTFKEQKTPIEEAPKPQQDDNPFEEFSADDLPF